MSTPTKRPGRPKSESTKRLESATIGHLDAVARSVAREIRELLSTHARRGDWEYLWWQHCETVHQRMAQFVKDAVAITGPAGEEGLQRLVGEALAELSPRGQPHPAEPPPKLPAPSYPLIPPSAKMPRSRSVADARARLAELRGQRLDIMALVGTDYDLSPTQESKR